MTMNSLLMHFDLQTSFFDAGKYITPNTDSLSLGASPHYLWTSTLFVKFGSYICEYCKDYFGKIKHIFLNDFNDHDIKWVNFSFPALCSKWVNWWWQVQPNCWQMLFDFYSDELIGRDTCLTQTLFNQWVESRPQTGFHIEQITFKTSDDKVSLKLLLAPTLIVEN